MLTLTIMAQKNWMEIFNFIMLIMNILFKEIFIKVNPWLKKAVIFFTLAFLLSATIFLYFWWSLGAPKDPRGREMIFSINSGQGLREISSALQKYGLIRSGFFFKVYAVYKGSHRNILAGKYVLSPAMSMPQILFKIISGIAVREKITIIEGWDLGDIANYFESKGVVRREVLFKVTGRPASLVNNLFSVDLSREFYFLREKPSGVSLEGYLFPDTYEISGNDSPAEIVRKMLANFNKKISPELKKELVSQDKSLFSILTMASLLEKEVKSYNEKQIAAGILWKRLEAGWPLQVDATLAYLTGRTSAELTREDLEIDSPYNTYVYLGLPKGPICNPGLESINAAVYYKESPYWFYLATSEGKTIFSKTLQEHNINKEKYLK